LRYQSFEKKTDGWYFGDNVPEAPRIRNLECSDTGYNDIRQQTRRTANALAPVAGAVCRCDRPCCRAEHPG